MKRRTLIRWILSVVAAFPLRGLRLRGQAPGLAESDEATLQALGEAVLPSTLTRPDIDAVARDFLRWVRGYEPDAEMSHGYGITRLRVTGPLPAARYPEQLADLRAAARSRGARFEDLPSPRRRELAAGALETAHITELPSRPDGGHVVSDLLSFYFQSTAANDLCYQAAIGRDTCRGLPDSGLAPRPL